jgi:LysM repeat protein
MAPEQMDHPGEVDHRADIYALGVVFYQMLTGELPGKKSSRRRRKFRLTCAWMKWCCARWKKPELRYQQVSEVKTMVETIARANSQSPTTSAFGPVVERLLTNNTAINFGSGQMKPLPGTLTRQSRSNEKDIAVCAWLEQANTDFAFLGDDGIYGMVRDMTTLKRGEWESYTPEKFPGSLHDLGRNVASKFGNAEPLNAETNYTYAFKTGAGHFGLLQITGYTDNPRGVKIRYKLVQNVAPVLTNAIQPLPNPGIPAPVTYIPPQISSEQQPPLEVQTAAAPGRPVLLAVPVLGLLLILAVMGTVLFLAIKKWKSGTGKAIAIGCGVLVLGAFLVLALLLLLFFGFRQQDRVNSYNPEMVAAKAQAEAQMAAARTRAEVQMAEAKARAEKLQAQATADANLNFGPVIERVLHSRLEGTTNWFLDFETGKVLMPPPELAESLVRPQLESIPGTRAIQFTDWVKRTGVDLAVYGPEAFETLGGIWVQTHGPTYEDWDDLEALTPAQTVTAIRAEEKQPTWSGRPELSGIGSKSVLYRNFSVNYFFKTRDGTLGVLQVVGKDAASGGLKLRYRLLQNSVTTVTPASVPTAGGTNSAASPFRTYTVNNTYAELARMANTNTPEGIAARFFIGLLGSDPTAAVNRYVIDLPRLPPGAVKISVPEENRNWGRRIIPKEIIIYREELAAVILPQLTNDALCTVILGKRKGEWKVCLQNDLPDAPTLAQAEAGFRDRAPEIYDMFQMLPDQQPSLVEDATRQLTTNLTQMAEAMVNSVRQMMSQVPGMQIGTPIIQSSMTVTVVTNTPNAASANEEGVYLIASGDTVAKIAGRFGLSVADFMAMNPGLVASRLKVGQKVIVFTQARLKLQQAELNLKNAEMKFSIGTITEYELQKNKLTRDLAVAEANGDAPEIARLKLAVAELDLDVAGKQLAIGRATQLEYTQARLARDYAAAAAQRYFPGPAVSPSADLKARLEAASSITSFTEQDKALAAIVRDAAKAGEAALAKQALAKMTSFTAQDQTALEAARALAKAGRRTDAIDIARSMTSFTLRDAALKELAQ